ncbi:MAG: class I SAM-dependent methyltransferase [Chloroflexi bacterium]|nr:class I SAM-dependent methyltransferase [Chloroflexota bacterium]
MPEEPEGYVNYVQRVYESRSNDELASNYDAWADTYDQDTIENWGRLDPDVGAEIFAKHVPTDARILDAGAGTGIVGKLLSDKGYRKIAGIDLSEGMLQQARSKGVYQELRQMTLGERLDFPDDAFDAVVSIGVFTQGHARPGSFDELIRVTRPGGKIVFGLRTDIYEDEGFQQKQSALEAEGRWTLVERSRDFLGMPKKQLDKYNNIWVYEVS